MTGYEAAKIGGAGSLEGLARRLKSARCGHKEARLIVRSPPQPVRRALRHLKVVRCARQE